MIPFNRPAVIGNELNFIEQAIESPHISGDGTFTNFCCEWFEKKLGSLKTLLTPSCTHALEMSAVLIDIQRGDEVIMPSYTFVSTANAFVLRGAKIIFVDIRKDTMNMDETLIESAITEKTRAIVPVHYAGVACNMEAIMGLAEKYNLYVIEDSAQGLMSTYKGKALGSFGHMSAFSFHETKNYTSGGEGGLLAINAPTFIDRAEVIREKGTNRSQFFRGMVDKYSWVDVGSSYLPSELQAAYLWGQLCYADHINDNRLSLWSMYYSSLKVVEDKGFLVLPFVPEDCIHNGHMFYIKVNNLGMRSQLLTYLKDNGVQAVFHYVPLHSSDAGKKFAKFSGEDINTTSESEKLIRLPLWYSMPVSYVQKTSDLINSFFGEN